MNCDEQAFLGIEIGGTKLQLVIGNGQGEIQARRRLQVAPEKGGAGIRSQIEAELKTLLRDHPVQAIGVGFGGPVNWKTGQIACSHQIEGWSEFPLGAWLSEQSGLPVQVENDANVAALGEAWRGAGAGFDPVFYVTLGSGVGGGLVVQGRVYHGASPGEAEIGHVRLNREGLVVEQSCSGWAVDRKIREGIQREEGSLLARLAREHGAGGEARFLGQALEAKDRLAEEITGATCEDLAFALSHVTQLMHPEIIIIGGGLSLLGEPLRERVERSLKPFVMSAFAPGPKVVLAGLREDAVPVGALKLAVSRWVGAATRG